MIYGKILIVGENKFLNQELLTSLKTNSQTVIKSNTDKILDTILHEKINIVIIDLNKKRLSHTEYDENLIKEIREYSNIPIIIIADSVSEEENEREEKMFLNWGADDYLIKPINVEIFWLRVKVILNRYNTKPSLSFFLDLEVDEDSQTVFIKDHKIELTPKEFELLRYLIENYDEILTREKILKEVWGYKSKGETRTVDTHIKQLRKKLGKRSSFIKTIRNKGYKFEVDKNNYNNKS